MALVCLSQMPYNSVERPSLALGLLKAYLVDRDITCDIHYGNLLFANAIDLAIYRLIEQSMSSHLLGEWTFAGSVFPEDQRDFKDYLERTVPALFPGFVRMLRAANSKMDFEELLWGIRHRATQFVKDQALHIVESGARIVGCSSMFQQNCASLGLMKEIKALDSTIITMMGGPNCENPMGAELHANFPWVDFIVTGEADPFFGEMCELLLEEGPSAYDEKSLPLGVLGPVHRTGVAPPTEKAIVMKMDDTAVPDYDDFFLSFEETGFSKYVKPSLMIETSRGCWWGVKNHCTFCGANAYGMTFRGKSSDRALREIRFLADRYQNNRFNVADNIIDMRYLRSVLPDLAAAEEEFHFFYQVKANLTREQMKMMSDAGVRWLQPGIESLHDKFLALVKKGTSASTNIFTLRLALEYGIRCFWNILLGIPGEEDAWYEDLLELIPLIFHLQPPDGFGPIRFDRFSPYFEQRDSFDLDLEPFFSYQYVYPLNEKSLNNIAYFFDHRSGGKSGQAKKSLRSVQRMKALSLVNEWKRHFWGSGDLQKPVLIMEDHGEFLEIEDTRPIAVHAKHRLDGLDAHIYRVLDKPLSQTAIVRYLEKNYDVKTDHDAVSESLERLNARKVILNASQRWMSLAVNKPVRPFPENKNSPASTYNLKRLFNNFSEDSFLFSHKNWLSGGSQEVLEKISAN